MGDGRIIHDVSLNNIQSRWSFIFITYDGNNVVFYQDGSFIEMITIGQISDYNNHSLRLGNWGSSYRIVGALSNVSIYNRALSLEEVELLYARGR